MALAEKKNETFLRILECFLAFGISLYAVTGQMFLLLFHRRYVYLYIAQLLFLGILLYMVMKKRVLWIRSLSGNLLFLSFFFSMTSAVRTMELVYVQAAVGVFCQFIVLYFIVAYVEDRIREERSNEPSQEPKLLSLTVKAMKLIILVHCIYVLIQFLSFRFLSLDLNHRIFIDILGMDTSVLLYGEGCCTGFTYSQPLLAPMYIMGLLMFTNPFLRLLIIIAAFLCRSSTSVAGAGLCVVLLFVKAAVDGKLKPSNVSGNLKKLPLWEKITVPVLVTIGVILVFATDMDEMIRSETVYLFTRVFGAEKGGQHFDYFRRLPELFNGMSAYQKLFGYGNNCSGYPMTLLGYTTFPGAAIVECDVVDTLLSRGLFGMVTTYGLLIYVGVKGWKKDRRYMMLTLCYLLMAAGYNIQWHYAQFFVLLLLVCLRENLDLFRVSDRVFTLRMSKKG